LSLEVFPETKKKTELEVHVVEEEERWTPWAHHQWMMWVWGDVE